jgi:hypothetical protein
MIQHVVVVKFKENVSKKEKDEIVAGLRTLPGKITEIRRFEVGLDVLHSERSYDFALVSTFDDPDAVKRYQAHPEHVPLAQRLRGASASLIAVDYELETPAASAVQGKFEKTVQNAAEKLMEDERLRSNLDDSEANLLVNWAIGWVRQRVSVSGDQAAAQQVQQAELARLRPTMSSINALLADGKTPNLVSATQALGLTGAKVVASGVHDRKAFIQFVTAQLVEEWGK